MFSHGSIVGGLITLWVLQEATVLKMRPYIKNEASDTDNDIDQHRDTKHNLKTKNKCKQ